MLSPMNHPELLWLATPPLPAQRWSCSGISPHTQQCLSCVNATPIVGAFQVVASLSSLNSASAAPPCRDACQIFALRSPLSRPPASPPRSELQDAVGAAPLRRCSAALVDAFVRPESYIGSARVCTESDSPPCAFSCLLNTGKHDDDDELERPRTQRHPLRRRRRRSSAQLLKRPRRHLSSSPSPP
ncbi:hypothetical protein C8F01DRAFT_1143521 [Mycena amicta]|nr:hypothetical protein C8F01DRAFT_1143521 [Mycena amicta]